MSTKWPREVWCCLHDGCVYVQTPGTTVVPMGTVCPAHRTALVVVWVNPVDWSSEQSTNTPVSAGLEQIQRSESGPVE